MSNELYDRYIEVLDVGTDNNTKAAIILLTVPVTFTKADLIGAGWPELKVSLRESFMNLNSRMIDSALARAAERLEKETSSDDK